MYSTVPPLPAWLRREKMMPDAKRCCVCKQIKPISNFSKRVRSKDGFEYRCKSCINERISRYYESNLEKAALKKQKLKNRNSELSKKYRQQHPDRNTSLKIFGKAKRIGSVKMEPCRVCGENKSEGHHPDYNHPLDVVWLCRKHHREVHAMARDLEKQL